MALQRGMAALAAVSLLGCGKKGASRQVAEDAASIALEAGSSGEGDGGAAASLVDFPELAELPKVAAVREVQLPVRIDVPRFEVYGPIVSGGVALVASSQLGFAAIDWREGKLLWTRPAGAHVAPPLVLASGDFALLGDCATAPQSDEPVLACLRIVSSAGVDRSYRAVEGTAKLAAQLRGQGPQRTSLRGSLLTWQRGEATALIDLESGRAEEAPSAGAAAPQARLIVRYKATELAVSLEPGEDGGELTARSLDGRRTVWKAPGRFAALLGTVPGQEYEAPMLRVVRSAAARGMGGAAVTPYFDVLDIDAMTAAGGQAAFPSPGLLLLGHGTGEAAGLGPAAALAIRLDRSLRRDYVVAYDAGARISWAYPLPVVMRTDPVGIAVTDDAVLAFHDGDTLTVLPPIE